MQVDLIIPAFNEEDSIVRVIQAIPPDTVNRVIVVDNGSTDDTARRAREDGVEVVYESQRGYGSACQRGVGETKKADILVFLDADYSDDPAYLPMLVRPIRENHADFVVGSRSRGHRERGALPLHARFGNWVACLLIRLFFGVVYTDLGPFRAIRRSSLESLGMQDSDYGWTVEMQIKAAMAGLRCLEIPVPYRQRIGRSKISGTVSGSFRAGVKILYTLFALYAMKQKIGNRIQ